MDKVVLIIGSETLLGRKLIELSLNKGYKVIAPVMTSQEKLKESSKKTLQIIPWNRSSVISSKTVIRESLRAFGKIDSVLFVHPDVKINDNLQDTSIEMIEETLNTLLHGSIYLIKELLGYFIREEKGSIAFAETEKAHQTVSPLTNLISGGFHSFSDSILQSLLPGIYKCAFTTKITEMDDYAEFILNILSSSDDRADGEWLKFTEKKGIFQSLPIIKRK
ncbi:MAG: hypothetical protein B6241_08395 [Spirochaetaceae bacterium 4572_59]|nr:MAG: hypothetical protein B6241_08395 [Spirochaetaceae bacterium 4572_59]